MDSINEPPETPAPVFAMRAFKTAIFGSPKLEDQRLQDHMDNARAMHRKLEDPQNPRPRSGLDLKAQQGFFDPTSPSKPAGILLTPGTGAARRKTVSFGMAVKDNEDKQSGYGRKSGLPNDFPGKFPSPWIPKTDTDIVASKRNRTNLTKILYEARESHEDSCPGNQNSSEDREEDNDNAIVNEERDRPTGKLHKARFRLNGHAREGTLIVGRPGDEDADITIDFDAPRSGSGRHWKSKYERHHERTKEEMKKLLKYKAMARSYARKKDSEALELSERLEEEREKVVRMESEISALASEIALFRLTGDETDPDHAALMKKLTRQTAKAMEYKEKVDVLQEKLDQQAQSNEKLKSPPRLKPTSPTTEEALAETAHQLRQAKKQLKEIDSLQIELREARDNARKMSNTLKEVERAKDSLQRELGRVREDLHRSETRRATQEERLKQREERLETQKADFKERLADARAERLKMEEKYQSYAKGLKTKSDHELVNPYSDLDKAGCNGEIASLRKQLDELMTKHQKSLKDHQEQVQALQPSRATNDGSVGLSLELQEQQRRAAKDLRKARDECSDLRVENARIKEDWQNLRSDMKDVSRRGAPYSASKHRHDLGSGVQDSEEAPQSNTKSSASTSRQVVSQNVTKLSASPLIDLSINTSYDNLPIASGESRRPSQTQESGFYDHRPPSQLENSFAELPSLENSISSPSKPRNEARMIYKESPRPSIFNLVSSPPKIQPFMPINESYDLLQENHRNTGNVGRSNGLASAVEIQKVAKRSLLPPDRAAAAKERLAQRNAEKQKARMSGKENVKA
ncbi:MAG: hypothetical protein M1824_006454 [Vezdaea acicularis]|nr:MAG: hypothetical protein M1824_006454 [Vezdaea acicularis]